MFEWDERKRLSNLKKHGVDFADALEFGWETATVTIDDRFNYGEERLVAVGLYRGDVHVVIYTERKLVKRLISFRKATEREAQEFFEQNRPQRL